MNIPDLESDGNLILDSSFFFFSCRPLDATAGGDGECACPTVDSVGKSAFQAVLRSDKQPAEYHRSTWQIHLSHMQHKADHRRKRKSLFCWMVSSLKKRIYTSGIELSAPVLWGRLSELLEASKLKRIRVVWFEFSRKRTLSNSQLRIENFEVRAF